MFQHPDTDLRFEIVVRILQPLSLADWIEDEDDIALAGESLGEALVRLGRLAVRGVAATSDDAGERKLATPWDVEVGGDQEAGAALEDQLFDSVRITLDRGGDARVEGGLFGEGTEALLDLRADRGDVLFGVVSGLEGFEQAGASRSRVA